MIAVGIKKPGQEITVADLGICNTQDLKNVQRLHLLRQLLERCISFQFMKGFFGNEISHTGLLAVHFKPSSLV